MHMHRHPDYMNMNNSRYNTFNQIHKGLRILLYETATLLQQTDLGNAETASPAIEQIEEVLFLFESHAHGEDHFFNEPIEKVNPQVSKLFQKEHEEDHRLSNVLNEFLSQWKTQTNADERRFIGRKLFYAFNEFIAFNLYHMNKEEHELNAELWKQYSDEEIRAIEQTLVQQIPPAKMARYAKWMVRGLNDVELTRWISEVKMFAPAEVFDMLNTIAKFELATSRYEAIMNTVHEHATA
jgi:hypothetical protein